MPRISAGSELSFGARPLPCGVGEWGLRGTCNNLLIDSGSIFATWWERCGPCACSTVSTPLRELTVGRYGLRGAAGSSTASCPPPFSAACRCYCVGLCRPSGLLDACDSRISLRLQPRSRRPHGIARLIVPEVVYEQAGELARGRVVAALVRPGLPRNEHFRRHARASRHDADAEDGIGRRGRAVEGAVMDRS